MALAAAVLVINRVDVYFSAAFAVSGDVYLFWMTGRPDHRREEGGKGFPVLLLVAFVPMAFGVILTFFGYFSSLQEALLRTALMTGFSIAILVSTFPLPLAIRFKILEGRISKGTGRKPLVTILVPAFNEQSVLSRTIESLRNVDYDRVEVIVIDDGSTDLTASVASWYKSRGVKVIRQPNGGKAAALNHGLLYARGEYIVTLDSDSMVSRSAIDEVIRLMETDSETSAVAGNVKVLNNKSVLTRVQELEYIMALNTIRRAYALFGTVMVIPGAFGAFRKSAVVQEKGYDRDTVTEDFDLTVRLLKRHGTIASSSSGVVYTEVPSTLKGLYKQRMRWNTGTFQTVYKHRDALWNKGFQNLHSVGFPLMLLSLFNPFASFLSVVAGVILAATGQWLIFLEMVGIFLIAQVFVAMAAISIDDEDYRLVSYAPLFVVGYRQFNDLVTILAAVRTMLGRGRTWNKLERTGGTGAIRLSQGVRKSGG
ncbi:MAG TPA: glycosyltransferase family 2 protein [Nitrososphaerales archaeon]|nr:glycosyltransferase family 2 protein [Nitrososphaerales archaeon]